MMNRSIVKVEGIGTQLPDDGKRCRLYGITVKATCPKCGMEHARDLGDHYLSYGSLNLGWDCEQEYEVDGEWITEGCSHSWFTPMRCEIRLIPLCNADHPTEDGVVCVGDQNHTGPHAPEDRKALSYNLHPALNPADYFPWLRDVLYSEGDLVTHNESVWRALIPNRNREPGGSDWGIWSKQ